MSTAQKHFPFNVQCTSRNWHFLLSAPLDNQKFYWVKSNLNKSVFSLSHAEGQSRKSYCKNIYFPTRNITRLCKYFLFASMRCPFFRSYFGLYMPFVSFKWKSFTEIFLDLYILLQFCFGLKGFFYLLRLLLIYVQHQRLHGFDLYTKYFIMDFCPTQSTWQNHYLI